jgi:hypothetical protein
MKIWWTLNDSFRYYLYDEYDEITHLGAIKLSEAEWKDYQRVKLSWRGLYRFLVFKPFKPRLRANGAMFIFCRAQGRGDRRPLGPSKWYPPVAFNLSLCLHQPE